MNNEDIENAKKINDLKEQRDIIDEIIKIKEYKDFLLVNPEYNNSTIQDFIKNITNKYRSKLEVNNYYTNEPGKDDIYGNQYNTLCTLENMIGQYVTVKFGEDVFKKML